MLEDLAADLLERGAELSRAGRADEAIACCEEVVRLCAGASETSLQIAIAHALIDKGRALDGLGRATDEIALYDEIALHFGQAHLTGLQLLAADALVAKAITLTQLGKHDDAIAACTDVAARFRDDTVPESQALSRMLTFSTESCWPRRRGRRTRSPSAQGRLALRHGRRPGHARARAHSPDRGRR